MGRARKRLAGTLKSQQESEDDGEDTGGRPERIFQSLQESAGKRDALWPDCDAWRPQSMFDVYYRLLGRRVIVVSSFTSGIRVRKTLSTTCTPGATIRTSR